MQIQSSKFQSIEKLLEELKSGKGESNDLLLRISEEFSNVSATSNQDNIEPLYALIEENTQNLPIYGQSGFGILNKGIARFYKTKFTEAIEILEPLSKGDYSEEVKAAGNMVLGAAFRSSWRIDSIR